MLGGVSVPCDNPKQAGPTPQTTVNLPDDEELGCLLPFTVLVTTKAT